MCFRTSADAAADPPVNPASAMTFELSGEITVRSRAAGRSAAEPVGNQNVSWPSATVVMAQPTSSFTLNTYACLTKRLSQYVSDVVVSYDNISLSLTSCCMVPQRI